MSGGSAGGGGHGGSGGAVGLEIERRWRLRQLPPALGEQPGARALLLEAGYIPGERIFERLRRVTECTPLNCSGSGSGAGESAQENAPGCDCRVRLLRTVKAAGRLVRIEAEEALAPPLFERLWPATEGHRLRKRRFVVPVDGGAAPGLAWEVDEVLDGPRAGLVLLELELGTAAASPPPFPAWLAPFVAADVTESFSSSMLVGLGGDAQSLDADAAESGEGEELGEQGESGEGERGESEANEGEANEGESTKTESDV